MASLDGYVFFPFSISVASLRDRTR